ncbi:MAG TPA: amidohydrolase family protein [Candidatus Brocadiia bacterium]|nr:amidohydrolase family protein [Candidatus Brocadiia bacterium]
MFDLLIKNGTVIDGSGKPGFRADVGVAQGMITLVGRAENPQSAETIEADRKVVCPGFIDPHSHADLSIFRHDHDKLLEPLARQGITTFIGGNCGMALAPLGDKHRQSVEAYIEVFTKLDFEKDIVWSSMGGFLDTLEKRGMAMNAAILAPHGVLRINEIGQIMRYATKDEIAGMSKALDQAIEEGAIGLSTGLQYIPGSQSDTSELVELGKVLKKHDAIFTSHLRSYSETTLKQAVDEVITVSRENGIRGQVSHIFAIPDAGPFGPALRMLARGLISLSRWWVAPVPIERPIRKPIEQMMKAREQGVNVGMDIMPSACGFTHLLAFFPPWVLEGGRDQIIERIADPQARLRIRRCIENGKMIWPHIEGDTWSLNLFKLMGWECARIMAVGSEKNKRYEGVSLMEIARERGVHPIEAACDLLLEEHGHVIVFESLGEPDDRFTERSFYAGLRHPDVMISTDAILMGMGMPSRLFYGCYPQFLGKYARGKRMLPLETAIRKSTGLVAEHFRLKGRGRIAEGCHADIVVFDWDRIDSPATFRKPEQFPVGIEHVFINGRHVVDGNRYNPSPRAGQLIRHKD